MNVRLLLAITAAFSLSAWAQTPPAAKPATAPIDSPTPSVAEPNVRLTVIEDRGTRIEELRVRGQLTRISVRPSSGGGQGYEIIPGRELRDEVDDRSGTAGAIGKRVWRVLSF